MKLYFSILTFFIFSFGFSQKQYPKNYFSPPLKVPVALAGTFGELRSNHFHSGVDIKTLGKEGLPIYAPADGYISRIKVAQYGFGKALYIKHPNGYTTVYAHLQKFAPHIQQYVKNVQYQKESYYTGNLFPDASKFPIKKGEIIGYTGDTGSSGGPHLHYEIRDSSTDHIINPLLFGLNAEDTKAPTIKSLMAFPLNEDSRINQSANKTVINFKNMGNGTYLAESTNASGLIGLGIRAYDQLNKAPNKNGLYSLEMKVNGERVYYHDVETFSFAESKYINLLIDYEHYANYKKRIQKTYKVKGNKLSLYEHLKNDGKLMIRPGENYAIEIIAKDYAGNTSTLKLPIRGVKNNMIFRERDTTAYKITATNFQKFHQKNVTLAFPKNSFYNDCYLHFTVEDGVAKVHEPTIPLDKKFTITFDITQYPSPEKKQLYIANVTKKKYPYYVSTKKKENKAYATTKSLGSYTLMRDSMPPTITPVNFKNGQWISSHTVLQVKIDDDDSGIDDYTATIDGEWVLMEYNHKKGILTYDFSDKKLVGSKHLFNIVVSDNVGNTKTLSATFYRK
ncbi:M23 family metallopeptidase [Tenacibaculum sp. IB213877]|uniref:M23 family metallopeptidase n=1 Tax=Tenacibaculum sp. IB213877 TaxID=3097351 RepID=UPI002A5AF663|nr:M23 family metallopeptidase [Tenacibaculum sp. IB213877]MDY0781525.1 M23 family metallopeptidase [Tenacibaculum sp. IB213877]